MKWPLVEIKWVDSCGPNGWNRLSTQMDDGLSEIVSVGFLVNETSRKKVLAAHIDTGFRMDDPNIDGIMHIPLGAITSIRVIEPAPEGE